jgi:hypothetical protein
MGLRKKGLFEAVVVGFGCAAFLAVPTAAYCQSATLSQFSDPYGAIASYPDGSAASEKPKAVSSKLVTKRKPLTARAPSAWSLGEPTEALTSPVTPSVATHVPDKDSPLGFSLKWSAENDPYYNSATSTITAVDQIKRDLNETPAEAGSGVEAGVNLKF